MIIKAHNVPDECPLLVRDIAFGGNGEPTVQVTFEPAWPAMLDAPREGARDVA